MKTITEILAEIDRRKKLLLSDNSDEEGWAYRIEELRHLKSFITSGEECQHKGVPHEVKCLYCGKYFWSDLSE